MSDPRLYTKADAERYVKYLGLWSYANPVDMIKRRDDREYIKRLENLIKVNQGRTDKPGVWETQAAQDQLKILNGGKTP